MEKTGYFRPANQHRGMEMKNNEEEGRQNGSPFFTFAKPYFDFIGRGKIYSIVYIIMAIINLLLPLVVIYAVLEWGYLQYGGTRAIVAFIFSWLVIAFACWIGFQLWWYRKASVKNIESADFIATPVISEIFQVFGEWLGTLVGIIGAGVGIISLIFLGDSANDLFSAIGIRFMDFAPLIIIIGPVAGFLIIVTFRFLAEQIRIFAAIANNTKDIANK